MKIRVSAICVGLLTMATGAAAQSVCPSNATGLSAPTTCVCPAGGGKSTVWGTALYTTDSHICTAARHAGVIDQTGGMILVTPTAGQASYTGSEANGVSTNSWGSYGSSFVVSSAAGSAKPSGLAACGAFPTGADSHSCSCAAGTGGSTVWGSGPYTSDSDICKAARHAGVIGSEGGDVTVMGFAGLSSYAGTQSNGEATQSYGSYGSSFVFNRN